MDCQVVNVRALTVAAPVSTALAGCGQSSGPSVSQFKSGFVSDRTQFRELGRGLGRAIGDAGSQTNRRLATELAALSTRASRQAARLDAPPKFQAEPRDADRRLQGGRR